MRFLFQKMGYIAIEKDKASEDAVMEAAIEAGADDVETTDQYHEIKTVARRLRRGEVAARGARACRSPSPRSR